MRGLIASIVVHVVVIALLCHESARFGSATTAEKDSRLAQHFELSSDSLQLLNLGPAGARTNAGNDTPAASIDPVLPAKLDVVAELPKPVDVPSDPIIAASSQEAGNENERCEVRVHQSPYGRVEAFELGDCRGGLAWRQTMIALMRRAAALVTPASEPKFAALRTIILVDGQISPSVVAIDLSSPDFHGDTFVGVVRPNL